MRGRKKRRTEAALAAQGQTGPATPEPRAESAKPGKPPKVPRAKEQPKPKGQRLPKGPARQTRMTRLVGLAFCVGGFVAIGLAWSGAAGKDCVECQLPYLLSGGATGIGLIVFGVGMMVMAQLRTEGRRLADRLDQARSASLGPDTAPPAPNGSLPSVTGVAGEPSQGPAERLPESGASPPMTTRAGSG